jgi:cobalt-zinc-cadmium efflux system outer membrane protein
MQAARDQTAVTGSQVSDSERGLRLNVAQQFLGALLAKSNLELANKNLEGFRRTVDVSESRYKAGDISQSDFLKIKLQLLEFQTDVSAAQLGLVQALGTLRQLIGYDGVPPDYDVVGDLQYSPLQLNQEDLQAIALKNRPDLAASQRGVTAAQSQYRLARSNGKRDLTTTVDYTHVSALNNASFFFNIEIPIFNRNQGEKARTQYAITQAEENQRAVVDIALTDVANAYQAVKTNEKVVQLYLSGYLQQAQDSRDISEYAYKQGAASLLDFLDAERSYRATQLAYRQSMANYMLTVEQLKAAAGTRTLSH